MKHRIEILKFMAPFPHTVEKTCTLAKAEEMFDRYDSYMLPVTEDGIAVGVLSRRELNSIKKLLDTDKFLTLQVSDLTIEGVYVVTHHESAVTVLSHMQSNNCRAAIITNTAGRVVGLFSYKECYGKMINCLIGKDLDDEPPDITA